MFRCKSTVVARPTTAKFDQNKRAVRGRWYEILAAAPRGLSSLGHASICSISIVEERSMPQKQDSGKIKNSITRRSPTPGLFFLGDPSCDLKSLSVIVHGFIRPLPRPRHTISC